MTGITAFTIRTEAECKMKSKGTSSRTYGRMLHSHINNTHYYSHEFFRLQNKLPLNLMSYVCPQFFSNIYFFCSLQYIVSYCKNLLNILLSNNVSFVFISTVINAFFKKWCKTKWKNRVIPIRGCSHKTFLDSAALLFHCLFFYVNMR